MFCATCTRVSPVNAQTDHRTQSDLLELTYSGTQHSYTVKYQPPHTGLLMWLSLPTHHETFTGLCTHHTSLPLQVVICMG